MKIGLYRLLLVARQEFLNGVRSRAFLLATFGLPLLMSSVVGITVAFSTMGADRTVRLVLVDESSVVGAGLAGQFPERFTEGELEGRRRVEVDLVSINSLVDVEHIMETLSEKILAREIDGFVHLKEGFLQSGEAEYFGLTVSNLELNLRIQAALSRLLRQARLKVVGIDKDQVEDLLKPATLDTFRVNESGAQRDNLQTFALVYALVLLLYVTVVLYGARIGRSVLEEKISRIVEVMLSAVRPIELLGGKVLGVGAMGLLQTGVWGATGLILMGFRESAFSKLGEAGTYLAEMPDFPVSLVFHFLAWFLLGYFLYALVYALIASIAGSEREAEQLQAPVSLFLLLPLVAQVAIIKNPDSSVAVVMSMIPFFSPVVMFMRTAVLTPPALEIALSMGICAGTILVMLLLTARIYRVGILSSGRRPPLRQLMRWLLRG